MATGSVGEPVLHADELVADAGTVRRLVDTQFPRWRGLQLRRLRSAGSAHVLYRLGKDFVVRLPRRTSSVTTISAEVEWLPTLAGLLPLPVPEPVAVGVPGEGFPWPWAVYRWLPGQDAWDAPPADEERFVGDLAEFVLALHAVPVPDVPVDRRPGWFRAGPLSGVDHLVREGLAGCRRLGLPDDLDHAAALWREAVELPEPDRPDCWVHTDLIPFNLLVTDGRLSAVVDFGGLSLGDPTIDAGAAWAMVSPRARDTYRRALGVDDATWLRARGWTLALAVDGISYYWDTHPQFVALGRRRLAEVLADAGR